MRRRLPPPNWLRAFEAAARHLSFTAAARELHVTPSAVSQQVRLLEQHLREPLFHRLPRGLQLTTAGAAFLPVVSDAFERMAARVEEVFSRNHRGVLAVRMNTVFAVCWLAPRLQEFRASHPNVDIRINTSVWPGDTESEAFALEVRLGAGEWPGLRSELIMEETLTPVCAPAVLLAHPGLKVPSDVLSHPLLHVLGNREGWPAWLDAVGVEFISGSRAAGSEILLDTSAVALELASAGAGIALGHRSLVSGHLDSGRLVAPFELALGCREAFYLVSPESRGDTPDAAAFRAWILEEAHKSAAAIGGPGPEHQLDRPRATKKGLSRPALP